MSMPIGNVFMGREDGSSNSGRLRGMPGVNMALNQVAGEGAATVHYDAPLGAKGLVMLVECCAPSPCFDHNGKSGRANCGCFRPDGGYINAQRAGELAVAAGWCPLLPGRWLCPYHVDLYGKNEKLFTALLRSLQASTRLAEIRAEGGVILG